MAIEFISGMERARKDSGPYMTFATPPDANNILNMCFTGFTTDQNGPACGQREQADLFLSQHPGSDYLIWSWAQLGWGTAHAVEECVQLAAVIKRGNARGAYTRIIASGHSFGGNFLLYFLWYLSSQCPDISVHLARFLDPVPNADDTCSWVIPPNVKRGMQWTQKNGMGWWFRIGPNGTPILNGFAVVESVYFPMELIPTIDHISLVTHPLVWAPSLDAMNAAVMSVAATQRDNLNSPCF